MIQFPKVPALWDLWPWAISIQMLHVEGRNEFHKFDHDQLVISKWIKEAGSVDSRNAMFSTHTRKNPCSNPPIQKEDQKEWITKSTNSNQISC